MTKEEKAAYDKEYKKKWALRHPNYSSQYYHKHKKKSLDRNKEWRRKADPRYCFIRNARVRALKRKIEFSITENDVVIPTHCPILGIELKRGYGIGGATWSLPSLDRIDSSKGYIPGNVAVISRKANIIKNNGTAYEHRLIADWMDKKLHET